MASVEEQIAKVALYVDNEGYFEEDYRLEWSPQDVLQASGLRELPEIYRKELGNLALLINTVRRRGSYSAQNPAYSIGKLIELCVREFPDLAAQKPKRDALAVGYVSALDAAREPLSLLRNAYNLFQSTAQGHETFSRSNLRRLVDGMPEMKDDELWQLVERRALPVSRLAGEIFAVDATGPDWIIDATRAPIEVDYRMRFEHTHILAPTGMGKTTLMQRDILADLKRDNPPATIVVEPTGTMVNRLRSLDLFHPEHGRLKDRLIVIDATNLDAMPELNMFSLPSNIPANVRNRIEAHTTDLLAYIFSSADFALTPKMSVGFVFMARLMFRTPGANLSTMLELVELSRKEFENSKFAPVVESLDQTARRFFRTDFFGEFNESKSQIKARIYLIQQSTEVTQIFDAPRQSIDWFDCLQKRKIVLVNTGSTQLNQAGHQMLGRYVITSVVAAVYARTQIAEANWEPAFLYIDEAHLFVDPRKTQEMLSQVRKYKLGITLAMPQMTGEGLTDGIRTSISTNTAIKYAASVEGVADLAAAAQDMRCTREFIRQQKVTEKEVNFACFVRNHTYDKAFVSSAQRGNVEAEPQIDPATLMKANPNKPTQTKTNKIEDSEDEDQRLLREEYAETPTPGFTIEQLIQMDEWGLLATNWNAPISLVAYDLEGSWLHDITLEQAQILKRWGLYDIAGELNCWRDREGLLSIYGAAETDDDLVVFKALGASIHDTESVWAAEHKMLVKQRDEKSRLRVLSLKPRPTPIPQQPKSVTENNVVAFKKVPQVDSADEF